MHKKNMILAERAADAMDTTTTDLIASRIREHAPMTSLL